MRRVFQTQFVCRRERNTQFMIKLSVFKEKKCYLLYNNFVFCCYALPRPPNCIWNKPDLFDNASLYSEFFPICQKSFESSISSDFFSSGIGTDIFLINVHEDHIEFLTWAAWAMLNFYFKQKQRYSVWDFTDNASFISFHSGIWSRYSEIKKFKRSKGSSFQK